MSKAISTDNYTIGGGELFFNTTVAHSDLTGTAFETTANSLGNVMNIEINPEVEYIDHWVSVKGKRVKDKTVANTVSLMINFTFDEMNQDNLDKFFLGSSNASDIKVLQNTLLEGSARLKIDTDIGQDLVYEIPKCTLKPDGALTLSEDTWHEAPMILEVLEYQNNDTTNATDNAVWYPGAEFGKIETSNL